MSWQPWPSGRAATSSGPRLSCRGGQPVLDRASARGSRAVLHEATAALTDQDARRF